MFSASALIRERHLQIYKYSSVARTCIMNMGNATCVGTYNLVPMVRDINFKDSDSSGLSVYVLFCGLCKKPVASCLRDVCMLFPRNKPITVSVLV